MAGKRLQGITIHQTQTAPLMEVGDQDTRYPIEAQMGDVFVPSEVVLRYWGAIIKGHEHIIRAFERGGYGVGDFYRDGEDDPEIAHLYLVEALEEQGLGPALGTMFTEIRDSVDIILGHIPSDWETIEGVEEQEYQFLERSFKEVREFYEKAVDHLHPFANCLRVKLDRNGKDWGNTYLLVRIGARRMISIARGMINLATETSFRQILFSLVDNRSVAAQKVPFSLHITKARDMADDLRKYVVNP